MKETNKVNVAFDKVYELESAIEIAINKCMGNDVMEVSVKKP